MCGFVGFVRNTPKTDVSDTLERMTSIIIHRGPDSAGYYKDEYVNLGFRRLSIIDLEGGTQPLSYENERYWIIFNGEIYNYIELREELLAEGYTFQTESDTEVILATYMKEKENVVNRLRGMFGFVIWDKEEKEIFAARDHFGIKPFFYCTHDDVTYFASEKKSIMLAVENQDVSEEALQHYLTYQYVPSDFTLTPNVKKLLPGHYIQKKLGQEMTITRYFTPTYQPVTRSIDEEKKRIIDVMRDSVQKHMRSDVPVGSFLSGGIDSTAIVALAREVNPNLKTFTVGFQREGFSEIDYAKESADALGVQHISYVITPEEYMKELPRIIWHMDDPVADPAAIPLYFVAREARKHVTVVLSGEGADELFGGYTIYHEPISLRSLDRLPSPVQKGLHMISKVFPEGVRGKSFLERGTTPLEERYLGNAKIFVEKEKERIMKAYNQKYPYTNVTQPIYEEYKHVDDTTKMMAVDMHTWLAGDILVKADRMTMAHSLELRVPFLDKEVFKVASEIATDHRLANNTTKYVLREAMKEVIPTEAVNRTKLGFPVPIRHWLKHEMYDWARSIIENTDCGQLIHKRAVLELLEDHVDNKRDNSRKIWTVLVFMIWYQLYVEKKRVDDVK